MAMNIKNEQAQRLARELAERTGESLTTAVTLAVQERLERVVAADEGDRRARVAWLMSVAADAGPRWSEPFRSRDHGDLLYDDQGLPA